MKNLFLSSNYPTKEPKTLLTGRRWAWVREDVSEVYPTTDYTLKYVFVDPANGNKRAITAAKTNSKHVVEANSAETTLFSEAEYLVSVEVVRDSDQEAVVIDELCIDVKKDRDGRSSHAYKVLMAVRALIEGKASQDQAAISINGRSLQRFSPQEWTKIEAEYSARWEREKEKLALANGRKSKKRTTIRMSA